MGPLSAPRYAVFWIAYQVVPWLGGEGSLAEVKPSSQKGRPDFMTPKPRPKPKPARTARTDCRRWNISKLGQHSAATYYVALAGRVMDITSILFNGKSLWKGTRIDKDVILLEIRTERKAMWRRGSV